MCSQIICACQGGLGHPHGMPFGNIKFHLPIGLLLGKAVQAILQNLEINGEFYIPIKHTIISKEANSWPDIIRKIINEDEKRTSPKTEP